MSKKTLKDLRQKRGLSRKEVAKLIGTSEAFIGMLETGQRNASDKTKKNLAKLYNCDIVDIFSALQLMSR